MGGDRSSPPEVGTVNPCDRPPDLCPSCTRGRRGSHCVCGYRWPVPVLGMDDYTRRIGLDGVKRARRTLRVARARRLVDEDTSVSAA